MCEVAGNEKSVGLSSFYIFILPPLSYILFLSFRMQTRTSKLGRGTLPRFSIISVDQIPILTPEEI